MARQTGRGRTLHRACGGTCVCDVIDCGGGGGGGVVTESFSSGAFRQTFLNLDLCLFFFFFRRRRRRLRNRTRYGTPEWVFPFLRYPILKSLLFFFHSARTQYSKTYTVRRVASGSRA